MKKILSVIIVAALLFTAIPLTASAETTNGKCGESLTWTYNIETKELVISGTGDMYDYGYEENYMWKNVETVKIGDGVTSIGKGAFFECYYLKEIYIPKGIKNIGHWAFYYCLRLTIITVDPSNTNYSSDSNGALYNKNKTTLYHYPSSSPYTTYTLPASVEQIDLGALNLCGYVENFKVESGNKYFSSDSTGVLFNKDKSKIIQYNIANPRETYTIPSTVKAIEDYAFIFAVYLKEITIPNNVKSLGYSAFYMCQNLEKVTLPEGITYIPIHCFSSNKNLKEVYIPASVTFIDFCAFDYCENLTTVYYGGTLDQWKKIDIDEYNDCLYSATKVFSNAPSENKAKIGDLNNDNTINSADALSVLQGATGLITFTAEQKEIADVNKDGSINSADALRILQYATSLIPSL